MYGAQEAGQPGLAVCPLMCEPVEGRCHWCARELPATRRRWCSDACARNFEKNHWWPAARRTARRRDKYACRQCGRKRLDRIRLEVNHIEPALGRHSEVSCAHHLSNLETLCDECHRAVSAAQRNEKRGKARAGTPANRPEFA
ncbi:MAG: HNH endonuclease [Dehalococcoidia bacterium]|nr:HNH endonuclease [Dehalococcoidia bacterium]